MYWKLAIQNIRRSLRDYIIYLVTLTLTAALMYSFLALGFSSDVLAMAENMSMLTTGILLMSALVAFMSSFVIGYAIRFMLGRRKKEFATYELIGMEAKTVRNLFLAENSIIGLSLIHISEPTRRTPISYAVFCLKKKKNIIPNTRFTSIVV